MLFLKLLPSLLVLALGLGPFVLEHWWRDRRTRRYRYIRNALVVLFVLSALASVVVTYQEELDKQRQTKQGEQLLTPNQHLSGEIEQLQKNLDDAKSTRLSGDILPGSEADPPHNCGPIPEGALKVFMGGGLYWFSRADHVAVIRVGDLELLSLDRSPSGYFVSASLFRDEDDHLVAKIRRNRFELNRNIYFENQSRDRHELRILDKNGHEVLGVRFLNESTFVISGIFRVPGRQAVIADRNSIQISGLQIIGACTHIEGATIFKF